MKIKTLLPTILVSVAALALTTAGMRTYGAWQKRQDAATFLLVNHVEERLLDAAGDLALERGLTVNALGSLQPISPTQQQAINTQRAKADDAYADAVKGLAELPVAVATQEMLALAERQYEAFKSFRKILDGALAQRMLGRPKEPARDFVPSITGLIDSVRAVGTSLETLSPPSDTTVEKLVQIRALASDMAEYAGRDRAALAGWIGTGGPVNGEALRVVARQRGRVEADWAGIQPLSQRDDLSPALANAIRMAGETYIVSFQKTRESILKAAEIGTYPMTADEWVSQATAAINTVRALTTELGAAANHAANESFDAATWEIAWAAAVLVLSLAVAAFGLWVIIRRIATPVASLTDVMGHLASGHLDVRIEGTDRGDEIGAMARAVEVFKRNAIERERLEQETAEQKHRAEAEKKQWMAELAQAFESKVGVLVQSLSSAATEMEASAQSMTQIADQTTGQSVHVASSAEETSANVQTVAAAAEEMSISIREIAVQISQSSRIAEQAASDAERSNTIIRTLSETTDRIGNVVSMINEIAGQTNLLALNATIEAARAGEFGRGFTVVAAEVKELAGQTTRATDQIATQISSVQQETQQAVSAIQEVVRTIGQMSQISLAIASAMEEQGAATGEIARNVQEAARGTEQVTESITEVRRGAGETGAAASQVLVAARELARSSEGLSQEVAVFLSNIRAI
ncbi:methyl-accepting chemotaxis protein [Microvirga sp. G4-2]|uniref:methyl-accepting chemotaxis protein n=1 Tax=Microvirga sp. G4-2 TaxID=3434467 RepID=UPI00404437DE